MKDMDSSFKIIRLNLYDRYMQDSTTDKRYDSGITYLKDLALGVSFAKPFLCPAKLPELIIRSFNHSHRQLWIYCHKISE